ncbi:hypothetical protein TYRP_016045 [Tyrophagus putrescentiae]|nr:hypothetical protein TYRP_016045 [Tyrophagus putrescentiae]
MNDDRHSDVFGISSESVLRLMGPAMYVYQAGGGGGIPGGSAARPPPPPPPPPRPLFPFVIRCVGHDGRCQTLPLDVLQNEDKDGQPKEKVADDDEGEDVLREKGAEDGSTWPSVHRYTAISVAVVPEAELALAPALQTDAVLLQADVRLLGAGSLFDALPAEGVITTGRGAGAPALVVVAGEALISGAVAGGAARLHVVLVIEQVWQLVVPRAIGVVLGWVNIIVFIYIIVLSCIESNLQRFSSDRCNQLVVSEDVLANKVINIFMAAIIHNVKRRQLREDRVEKGRVEDMFDQVSLFVALVFESLMFSLIFRRGKECSNWLSCRPKVVGGRHQFSILHLSSFKGSVLYIVQRYNSTLEVDVNLKL